jgi:hypothetical protein
MSLVNKAIEYETKNFWGVNPQLSFMKPFSDLYERDQSEGKEQSSLDMWVIFFLSDPDEEKNKFYRIPEKERIDMLKDTFHDIDLDDELIKECIDQYPAICLLSVERALKDEKDALSKRAKFLAKAEYDFETMKDLDNAYSKTSKIYENFEAIEQKFLTHREKSRVKGGRKESASEKGEI